MAGSKVLTNDWLGQSRLQVHRLSGMDEAVEGHRTVPVAGGRVPRVGVLVVQRGGRATSFFAWGEFDAVGLELLLCSSQIIGGGLQRSEGGTFGCCGGEGNEWGVVGPGLCSFVGDVGAL